MNIVNVGFEHKIYHLFMFILKTEF